MGIFSQQRHTGANVFKVAVLPQHPIPNAVYHVLKADHVEEWVTDVKGQPFQVKFDVPQDPGGGTGGEPAIDIATSVTLLKGQAVIVNASSQLALASASAFGTSRVVGLAGENTAASFACPLARSSLTLSDWTGIADASTLTPGATYFLGAIPGSITSIPPSSVGQCVAVIGEAISTTTLAIEPSDPIQL